MWISSHASPSGHSGLSALFSEGWVVGTDLTWPNRGHRGCVQSPHATRGSPQHAGQPSDSAATRSVTVRSPRNGGTLQGHDFASRSRADASYDDAASRDDESHEGGCWERDRGRLPGATAAMTQGSCESYVRPEVWGQLG